MFIQVFFVIPSNCPSEQDYSPLMVETFDAVKGLNLEPKWIKNLTSKETTCKTDCIVFEEFGGPLYDQVISSKSLIISPHCLLHCIKMGKKIPNSEGPLLSLALDNCIVVCSALTKENKKDIRKKVQLMAGSFSIQLVSKCKYLITSGVKSEKYHLAASMGIEIMSIEFINALYEASKTRIVNASDEEFQQYKCPVFLNLHICSTGFTKQETLIQNLVEKNGGLFSSTMDVRQTDILVCKSSASTSSTKYKAAVKHKIDCVTDAWIVDSVEKGYALPNVKDYSVKKATSTPTKLGDNVDPNFSQMSMIIKPTSSLASETLPGSIIERTMNQSFNKNNLKNVDFEELINNIDIKQAKMAGLFLDGCVIFLAGFKPEQKDKLCKILNFSGATNSFTLNESITHVILGSTKCPELKQINNKNIQCAVVSVNWLVDSLNEKTLIDVDNYLIINAESGSPICKKGLNFLRTDVSILETGRPNIEPQELNTNDQDDDVLQHYMTTKQGRNNIDDDLALNVNKNKQMGTKTFNPYDSPKASTSHSVNSPSISITLDESVNTCFANLKFVVVNYLPEEEETLVDQIKEMQGVIVSISYKGIPDYAVVPIDNHQSLLIVASNVVTHLWVTECVEQQKLIKDLEYYHLPCSAIPSNVLQDLCITFSGLDKYEKEYLAHLVVQLGGHCQDWMSRYTIESKNTMATTHLVTIEASGKKYQGAVKWGLPVVHQQWLLECAKQGKRVDVYDFIVGECKEQFKPTFNEHQAVALSTGTGKRKFGNDDVCLTPKNMAGPSSQTTPVDVIMERVRLVCGESASAGGGLSTPQTPKNVGSCLDDMPTPDTPYGACFQNPPPPALRKKWKRWIDKFPSPYKSPGTPLSEVKRKFWERYNLAEKQREKPSFDVSVRFPVFTDSENEVPTNQNAGEVGVDEAMDFESPCSESDQAMQDLIVGQIESLESHVLSSPWRGIKSLRPSIPLQLDKSLNGMIPEKDSQPSTIGWDENMVIPSVTPTSPPKIKHFMMSGVDLNNRDSLVASLEQLGATFTSLSTFDPAATHLLCDKLCRNEKLLASMASGLWILHISYVTDSVAAGKLLGEANYEFGSQSGKFKLDSDCLQRASAAKYWREEISRRGYGAFHDLRVIVVTNKKEPMIRVLQAGGAVIVDVSPPFDEDVSATHCLLDVKNKDLKPFIVLAKQGILCINTLYVNDFLHRTGLDFNDFIIPELRKYY